MTSLTSTPTAWGRWRCAPTWTCWSWRMSYGSTHFITKLLALQYRSTWPCTTNLWLMTARRARQTRVRLYVHAPHDFDLQVALLTMLWTGSYLSTLSEHSTLHSLPHSPYHTGKFFLSTIHTHSYSDVSQCKFRLSLFVRILGLQGLKHQPWIDGLIFSFWNTDC